MIFDLHVHTTLSSCSQLRLEDILTNAKKKGLDGVCITDHQTTDALKHVQEGIQEDGLLLIIGMEYATTDGDFLIFGPLTPLPDGMPARQLLQTVHEAGGVAVAAHPFREGRRTSSKIIAGNHCRIIEGRNGRDNGNGSGRAAQWQKKFNVHLVGGSDAHSLEELGRIVTVFSSPIHTREEFIEALQSGQYRPEANHENGKKQIKSVSQ